MVGSCMQHSLILTVGTHGGPGYPAALLARSVMKLDLGRAVAFESHALASAGCKGRAALS